MTLKDSRVLADDEDELQNVNLVDDAVLRAEKERKRKAQAQYTGFDDDEFDEGRIGTRPEVLAKYDEGFADTKVQDEGFRLGAALPVAKRKAEAMGNGVAGPTERVKLNLDYASKSRTHSTCSIDDSQRILRYRITSQRQRSRSQR